MRFQRSLFSFSNVAPSSSSRETKTRVYKGSPKAPAKETSARDANFPFLPSLLRLSSRETPFLVVVSHRRTLQMNSINTKGGDFFVSTFLDFLIEGAVFLNTQTTRALNFHWPLCVYFLHPPPTFIPTYVGIRMHLKKVRTPFSMETNTTKCFPTRFQTHLLATKNSPL